MSHFDTAQRVNGQRGEEMPESAKHFHTDDFKSILPRSKRHPTKLYLAKEAVGQVVVSAAPVVAEAAYWCS